MRIFKLLGFVLVLACGYTSVAQGQSCAIPEDILPDQVTFRTISGSGIIRGFMQYTPPKSGEMPTLYRTQTWGGSIYRKYYCAWDRGDKIVLSGANQVLDDGTVELGKSKKGYVHSGSSCMSTDDIIIDVTGVDETLSSQPSGYGGFIMSIYCRSGASKQSKSKTEISAEISVVGAPVCNEVFNDWRETGDTEGHQVEKLSNPDSLEEALARNSASPSETVVELKDFEAQAKIHSTSVGSWVSNVVNRKITVSGATSVTASIRFNDLCKGKYVLKYKCVSQVVVAPDETPPDPVSIVTDPIDFEVTDADLDKGYKEVEFEVPLIQGKEVWLSEVPVAISSSVCSEKANKATATMGSVQWNVSLGKKDFINSVGSIWLLSDVIDENIFDVSALSITASVEEFAQVIYNGDRIRQIMAPEVFVDIVPITEGGSFEVRMYDADSISTFSGGIYSVGAATPSVVYLFESTDVLENDTLKITETRGSNVDAVIYTYDAAYDSWSLSRSGGLVNEELYNSTSGDTTTEVRVLKNAQDVVVSKVSQSRRDIAGFEQVVERVEDPDGEALRTQWIYYEEPISDFYGRLKTRIDPTGYWETYTYDPEDLTINKTISQYGDAAVGASENLCRVHEVNWSSIPDADGDGVPERLKTEITSNLGSEISRSYVVEFSNITKVVDYELTVILEPDQIVTGTIEDFILFVPKTTLYEDRWNIKCVAPGVSWNDAGNTLVIKNRYYRSGDYSGRIRHVIRPDGLLSLYEYSVDADGVSSLTLQRGISANPNNSAVSQGTKTYTEYNDVGEVVYRFVSDIETGIITESQYAIDFDDQDRVTQYAYLNGTTTSANYNCCGLDNETDIYGNTTHYFYDDLDRLKSVESLGITTEYAYDAAGRTTSTTLIGTDDSEIVQSQTFYTPSGKIDYTLDALNRTTAYTRSVNASGQTVRTTVNPDGGTIIQTYYQDGQLESVAGSAAYPVRYEYGVVLDTHDGRIFNARYTKEIKIDTEVDEGEFVITYSDMLGRSYKKEYPRLTAAGTCQSLSFYNDNGQLVKTTGPDHQTMLYAYDELGRRTVTAIDANASGAIDYAGSDRIVRTLQTLLNDSGRGSVVRSTAEVWDADGLDTPVLVSTSDRALETLESWATQYGQTSHSETVLSGSGNYETLSTTPDGTISRSIYLNGYLDQTQVQHPDAGILSQQGYQYDVFGRLEHSTDLRNGTTDYTYYDDGRIHTVTSPDPDSIRSGEGYDPQVTTISYTINPTDGTVVTTTLPDTSTQVQKYTLTGQVQLQYGSATYPVEYGYDYAGRVDTMTTWKDFDQTNGVGLSGAATTQWIYNARGLLTEKRYDVIDDATYTDGPSYTYYDSGNVHTRSWVRGGLTTTYSYTPNTLDLLSIDYSDTTPDVAYTYERSGRVDTVTDGSGTRDFDYIKGRPQSEQWTAGLLNAYQIDRKYDEKLRPQKTSLLNGTTPLLATNYFYYADSRLQQVNSADHSFGYTYHADSVLPYQTTSRYRSQATMQVTHEWDLLNRLDSIATDVGSGLSPAKRYTYSYDSLNRRQIATQLDGDYWDYDYDDLGQVTYGKKKRGVGDALMPGYDYNYSFDEIGNRLTSGPTTSTDPGSSTYYSEANASGASGANDLNQYGSRSLSRALAVLGEADASATVTLNGTAASREGGLFYAVDDYSGEMTPSAARYETLNTTATISGCYEPS